jgi:hypothetical protein
MVGEVPTDQPTSYPISSATLAPTYTSVATPLHTPSVPYTPPPQQKSKTNLESIFIVLVVILIGAVTLKFVSDKTPELKSN